MRFDDRHSVFFAMAGLIVEMIFMLFSVITLRNGLKKSEYEVSLANGFTNNDLLGAFQEIIISDLSNKANKQV